MTVAARTTLAARVLLAVFALLLAYTVLLPSDGHEVLGLVRSVAQVISGVGLPFWLVFRVLEFSANIVMFVPFGVLVPLAFGRLDGRVAWLTIAAGAGLSMAIELSQLVIPGRVSSVLDVVANTLGAAVGVACVWVAERAPRSTGAAGGGD